MHEENHAVVNHVVSISMSLRVDSGFALSAKQSRPESTPEKPNQGIKMNCP
jgi:hypothetical protein